MNSDRLFDAIKSGDLEKVKELVPKGADFTADNNAAVRGGVEYLIRHLL